ncbi:hypothetical protein [Antiquaquibacter soli]|uniref:GGDEF domain-containing protein n=1 Tax=Antiquaquibacter soli TaxID=3064523 RepID=A0ABT9BS29_9MICO|nr:hypothetical protein [Protaetiibacter sp. WY-16]MDO7883434.1 hypothetical protein [Protaetiibacter sp. WY-16]
MVKHNYWPLDRVADRSATAGYLRNGDPPDSGAFAGEILRDLRNGPSDATIDVWVQARSESVPTHTESRPYSQFLALGQVRRDLREVGQAHRAGPFVHTMFGKTLLSFAVSEPQPFNSSHERPPTELASYLLGPLTRCRLEVTMAPDEAADLLQRAGWIASIASAVTRKRKLPSWHAESAIEEALARADSVEDDRDLVKCFTTPPWRGDASDLLTDAPLTEDVRDLHFPKLIRENEFYAEFASRRAQDDYYLLATDVHGLFDGVPGRWDGLRRLLLPGLEDFRRGTISFADFLADAYRIRLSVTRRLQHTLEALASIKGLECPIFARGDGIFAFAHARTLGTIVRDLDAFGRRQDVLPIGVGIVELKIGRSLRDSLARVEAALCITKLAPDGSPERIRYLYGEPVTGPTQQRLAAAVGNVSHQEGGPAVLTKVDLGVRGYHELLVPFSRDA